MKAGDDEMVLGIIREIRQQVLAFLPPKGATSDKIRASLGTWLKNSRFSLVTYKVLFLWYFQAFF